MEHDSLRQVRNSFYLGLYAQTLTDATDVINAPDSSPDQQLYANIYYHRALCFTNPQQVISKVANNAHTALQVVKQYATYLTQPEQHDVIVDQLTEWKANDMMGSDVTLTILLAHLYMSQKKYKEALQLVLNDAEQLEKLSLCVLLFLLIDRHDLASKQLKTMTDLDDDDVLTQLASSWVLLATPTTDAQQQAKVMEAEGILQGLQETFPTSQTVLTALAVCEMHKKSWTDAFKLLKEARRGAGEDGLMAEVLLDSMAAVQQMGRGGETAEVVTAIRADLDKRKSGAVDEEWKELQRRREADFEKQAANYHWTE